MRALLFVLAGSAACETSHVAPQSDAAELALLGPSVSLAPAPELDLDELRARLAKLEVALAELETLPDPDATEEVAAMQLRRLELVEALDAIERGHRNGESAHNAPALERAPALKRAPGLQAAIEQLEQDVRDTKRSAMWIGDPDEELLMRNNNSAKIVEESAGYEIIVENACWADAE